MGKENINPASHSAAKDYTLPNLTLTGLVMILPLLPQLLNYSAISPNLHTPFALAVGGLTAFSFNHVAQTAINGVKDSPLNIFKSSLNTSDKDLFPLRAICLAGGFAFSATVFYDLRDANADKNEAQRVENFPVLDGGTVVDSKPVTASEKYCDGQRGKTFGVVVKGEDFQITCP